MGFKVENGNFAGTLRFAESLETLSADEKIVSRRIGELGCRRMMIRSSAASKHRRHRADAFLARTLQLAHLLKISVAPCARGRRLPRELMDMGRGRRLSTSRWKTQEELLPLLFLLLAFRP
eukprot:scaffold2308_cov110-Pinguiococcus_pyrenoidosus.AAC.1